MLVPALSMAVFPTPALPALPAFGLRRVLLVALAALAVFNPSEAANLCYKVEDKKCTGYHAQTHQLPRYPGRTIYTKGFKGGTIWVKFQSRKRVDPSSSVTQNLVYNFKLRDWKGVYWIQLADSEDVMHCYAISGDCDVVVEDWEYPKKKGYPQTYLLS
ncbi:uncharacterized protein UV8b_06090 [Ustilaginoidea virens]|uniref:Uncharacterized protein n=1 Tax=Ustilaginoidea virens TaxID=1159556 RepID=A0A8E5HUL7_USTVR|nr:uncharacterized protein UV8b_06090 [Ustilaginoidea virens]QUC21849.1 hypothetical protein UV8b_06090 [Ustilaginoidea virens]